jgi:hypothetical protein
MHSSLIDNDHVNAARLDVGEQAFQSGTLH